MSATLNKGNYKVKIEDVFGSLTIEALYSDGGTSYARCKCVCGNVRDISINNLKKYSRKVCSCSISNGIRKIINNSA